MVPALIRSPSAGWTAGNGPCLSRICGRELTMFGGLCSTMNSAASRSGGSDATSADRLYTPPADAPTVMMRLGTGEGWSFEGYAELAANPAGRSPERDPGCLGKVLQKQKTLQKKCTSNEAHRKRDLRVRTPHQGQWSPSSAMERWRAIRTRFLPCSLAFFSARFATRISSS
jgi:hypothetical protein